MIGLLGSFEQAIKLGLRNVLVQQDSDVAERNVHIAGKASHAGSGTEGNQKDDEHVFDQALAFFIPMQPCQNI